MWKTWKLFVWWLIRSKDTHSLVYKYFILICRGKTVLFLRIGIYTNTYTGLCVLCFRREIASSSIHKNIFNKTIYELPIHTSKMRGNIACKPNTHPHTHAHTHRNLSINEKLYSNSGCWAGSFLYNKLKYENWLVY